MGKEVNSDLASALVASLSEGGVGRLFLAADGRSVTLYGAVPAPYRVRGKSRGRTKGQLSLSLGEKTSPSQLPQLNSIPKIGQLNKAPGL